MHGPGDELFAGSRLAQDQHIGIGRGNDGKTLDNFLHPGTDPHDVRKNLLIIPFSGILEALQVLKGLHPSQHPVARLLDL